MTARRLVVLPFELVRDILEPKVNAETPLVPEQILQAPAPAELKSNLYSSALNKQLNLKYPENLGDVPQPLEAQTAFLPPLKPPPKTRKYKKKSELDLRLARLKNVLADYTSPSDELLDINRKVVPNTNVTQLINFSADDKSKKRAPRGLEIFCALLHKLGVNKKWICNPQAVSAYNAFTASPRPRRQRIPKFDTLEYD